MASTSSQSGFSLWWAVPAIALPVLVVLGLVIGQTRDPIQPGSSYDSSDRGVLAAYLLLDELDFPVTRSRKPAGHEVRFALFPGSNPRHAKEVVAWLENGGRLVLADHLGLFARDLGIPLSVRGSAAEQPENVTGEVTGKLQGGKLFTDWPGELGQVWARAGGQPLVTIYRRGRGELWLIHRPEFLSNEHIGQEDNALVLCRLAEATLRDRNGPLAIDEFFHGYRDRPGVIALLLMPPTVWVTVHGLALLAVLLWRNVPRFGSVRPPALMSRRSREEFLEALALLLARRGDRGEAYGVAQDSLIRDMERELGLPPGPPEFLVAEASRCRNLSADRLRAALDPDRLAAVARPLAFVEALRELESIRDEFFARRSAR